MKFGLSFSGISPRHYPALAYEAEQVGFESVWIPDHLVFPEVLPTTYLYTESGEAPITSATAVYDPWVLLGAIASRTETIRLATNVYVLPLRHPIVTARGVLTVDRISRGRITLGAGVGWLKEEFDIVGEDPSNRGKRTDEIIPLLRRLWTEPVIEHHGEYYDIPPVYFEPKPFQRPIPIEIGGTSKAALRRAGSLGDGWIEIGTRDATEFADRLAVVEQARRDAGRADQPFIVTTGIEPEATADDVGRLADRGAHRAILSLAAAAPGGGATELSDAVLRFAERMIGGSS
jgi:probable F420-dependent oxidoreductase